MMFRSKNEELITYILAIIAVNAIFPYLRVLVPGESIITLFHILFGISQLVYLVPRIISILKAR